VRAVTEMAAELAADGSTEVTLVLPRRIYRGVANRLLHANTADRIVSAVAALPHVSATIAAFDVGRMLRSAEKTRSKRQPTEQKRPLATTPVRASAVPLKIAYVEGVTAIGDLEYRHRGRIHGRVHSLRLQPWSGVHTLECTVVDGTGAVNLVFLGRRQIPGLTVGTTLVAEGMVGKHDRRLAIINPTYEIILSRRDEKPAVS
jgi:hypothetical protein